MALLTMSPSTSDDVLRREAIDLATDATSLLVSCREAFRPEHAYAMAMECVRVADRIQSAHDQALPWEVARCYREARMAAVRARTALERTGTRSPLLGKVDPEVERIHHRLNNLAFALGALAQGPAGNAAA